MKQETAVDWLANKLFDEFGFSFSNNILQEAKQIEKKQIIKAHGNKKIPTRTVGNYTETYTGDQYYNETFKQ